MSELWDNPLFPIDERLEIARGAIAFRDKVIETKERRISELECARIAYASEFTPNAAGEPDVGNIHANIRAMKIDAERYRKWVSYSGFTKEHADATLDAISINEHAQKEG